MNTKELTQLLAREAEIQKEIANLDKREPELKQQIEDFLGDTPIDEIPPEKQKAAADVQLKISLIPGTKRRLEVRLQKCLEELGAAYKSAKREVNREVDTARDEFRKRVTKCLRPLFIDAQDGQTAESQAQLFLNSHENEFSVFRPFCDVESHATSASIWADYGVVWQVTEFLKVIDCWERERKALPKL